MSGPSPEGVLVDARARVARVLDCAGRLLAAALMLLGIGLFGILTASLSSFLVAESRQSDVARVEAELARLRAEVANLTRQLDAWMASRSRP